MTLIHLTAHELNTLRFLQNPSAFPKYNLTILSIFYPPSTRWVDQAIQFIEQVILSDQDNNDDATTTTTTTKVHLVGNSVGGHLAVFMAALRPDLVESVVLLNATPVWGLNLPGWSGQLPAPPLPRIIGRYLFDRMRDLTTIRKFLDNSYARKEAFDETLVRTLQGGKVLSRIIVNCLTVLMCIYCQTI